MSSVSIKTEPEDDFSSVFIKTEPEEKEETYHHEECFTLEKIKEEIPETSEEPEENYHRDEHFSADKIKEEIPETVEENEESFEEDPLAVNENFQPHFLAETTLGTETPQEEKEETQNEKIGKIMLENNTSILYNTLQMQIDIKGINSQTLNKYMDTTKNNLMYDKEHNLKNFGSHFLNGVKHNCHLCHKAFSRNNTLQRHMLTHTGEKNHECTVCHKKFAEKGNLKTHMLLHDGIRPHKCEVCSKTFTQRINLTEHMNTHTGERKYECHICHKRYVQKTVLNRHMQTHNGVDPIRREKYKCPDCGKVLSRKSYLDKHVLNKCFKK